jgi:adenine/guanine/hypoxanthine permease
MEQFFKLKERGTSVGQEARAGLTTFLAMAYIIAVNPALMVIAGVPANAAVTATCIGAGIMTILMGIFANRPLACAPGMGINAIVAFSLTALDGGDWHASMAVIFIEGIAILVLVLCGLREAVMDAIPVPLRHAISVGLGLFIAMIGLKDGGIIVAWLRCRRAQGRPWPRQPGRNASRRGHRVLLLPRRPRVLRSR